jgi:hypothetical protein
MRPFPPAAPSSATDRPSNFSDFKCENEKVTEAFDQFDKHRNERATNSPQTRYSQWRDRRVPGVLDCMARSRRQGSVLADNGRKWVGGCPPEPPPLTALTFAKDGLLESHARNRHSCEGGKSDLLRAVAPNSRFIEPEIRWRHQPSRRNGKETPLHFARVPDVLTTKVISHDVVDSLQQRGLVGTGGALRISGQLDH